MRVRSIPMYRHKNKYLESSLILCSFSRMIAGSSQTQVLIPVNSIRYMSQISE